MRIPPIRRPNHDVQVVEQQAQRKGLHRFFPNRRSASKAEIVVEDLSEKLVPIIGTTKFATVIHNLFTPEECADFIATTERKGYKEALIHGSAGSEVLRKDIRNSGRCIVDDKELSEAWFQRIMQALDGTPLKEKLIHAKYVGGHNGNEGKKWHVCGLNERLRYLRYFPGQYFSVHQDNSYKRGPEFGEREGETSYLDNCSSVFK